jgi:sorbitol-specific phosphotransferase system component IIA
MATWHFDENTADTLPAAIHVSSDPPPSEHEAFGPAAENQVQEEMAPNSLV